jgi:[ribosomal protein S5]-alanine N-acetyltransferase
LHLETERLIIRPIQSGDLEDFLEYRSDPKVCEFQGFQTMSRERAAKFIKRVENAEFGIGGEWIQLGVELKSENKVIGDIGLKPEKDETRVVEFGVSFSTKYRKQGFAKEALAEVFDLLFDRVGIHRIIGITDVKNENCIKLLKSLSFRSEAAFKKSFWDQVKNEWRDEYLYAMLKQDWRK